MHTSRGIARVHLWPATHPRHALVLGHGAGAGLATPDVAALTAALPSAGIGVIAVEQPWHVSGRRIAERPASLDAAWTEVLRDLQAHELRGQAPFVGGRSAGARVACRTAATVGARGVICLAFPLRSPTPGRASRADELVAAAAAVPLTVIQGSRDSFGTPEEVAQACASATVWSIPYADHSFAIPAAAPITRQEALDAIVDAVRQAILTAMPPGRSRRNERE